MFSVISAKDCNKWCLVTRILKLQGFSKMVMYLLFFYPEISPCQNANESIEPSRFFIVFTYVNEQMVLLSVA